MRQSGRFGEYGGCFVPQVLLPALEQLEAAFLDAQKDTAFKAELDELLRHYAGRPTPLYRCRKLGREQGIALYLKREDLLHGGAHKTNQVLGQGLLAKRMGKSRLIAETGAGQHGVATALAGALLGLQTRVYMGKKDMARQQPNVFRMRLMGAEVVAVENGSQTLKDAINEAMRDWTASYPHTHYMLGTAAGPHPYPTMVRDFQRIIGDEARAQILEQTGRLPDAVIACVGGGSNAIGIFHPFVDDEVPLIGVEPAGRGMHTAHHGATLQRGRRGILHGADTFVLQTEHGQIEESYSISAGLDYPGVGPEHVHLMTSGRARYLGVTDEQAVAAFEQLCQQEGILPALESAHALAYALAWRPGQDGIAPPAGAEPTLVVNLSGRGDKDVEQVAKWINRPGS